VDACVATLSRNLEEKRSKCAKSLKYRTQGDGVGMEGGEPAGLVSPCA